MSVLYDALLARRSASAKTLQEPGPSPAMLDQILFAGTRAPDHGRLVPYRLVIIENRAAFAELLAAATREATPAVAEVEVQRAAEKAHQGPCLVGLIGRIDPAHPKISASDQWLAVGCVLENLVLATQALGFQVAIRSGQFLETRAIHSGFRLADNEHFTCFLAIGTSNEAPPAKPRPELAAVSSVWNG